MIALLVLLLQTVCFAVSPEELLREELGVPELEQAEPAAAEEIYGPITLADTKQPEALLRKLWSAVTGCAHDVLYSSLRGGASLLAAALLAALCGILAQSATVSTAGLCVVALLCVEGLDSCYTVGLEALTSLSDLAHTMLPCLCAAAAASGAVTSSAAKYAASMLYFDGLISLEQEYAVRLLSAYSALIITARLTDHPLLQTLAGLMKQALKWGMILITAALTVYLSLTGILTGAADAAASKTVKLVLSSALPVVGGILSNASSALLSGAQMLRNGIGTLGMLFALAVCVLPYLTLGSHYLVFQMVGAASASAGDAKIGGLIRDFGSVYGFLLGMVGMASVFLFVSVISLMKTVIG